MPAYPKVYRLQTAKTQVSDNNVYKFSEKAIPHFS